MRKLRQLFAWGALCTLSVMSQVLQAETMTVVSNTSSGIQDANYTATLSDGTVLGFNANFGNSDRNYFCGAISSRTELTVPDSLLLYSSGGATMVPVRRIGYNRLDFDKAAQVTSLTIPATIIELKYLAPIKELHVKSYFSSVNTGTLSVLDRLLVPADNLDSYLGDANWYNYVFINAEGMEPTKLTINVTKPGEFAQLLLEKTDNWNKVNELTVTGSLNDDDLNVFKRMKQLLKLDLSKAAINKIPNKFDGFNYWVGSSYAEQRQGFNVLETLVLPELESIGDYAFTQCYRLKSLTMPKVKTIGIAAFAQCGLSSISLPEGLTSMGNYAFFRSQLTSVTIPNSMTTISGWCFNENSKLAHITLPETVTELGTHAISCTSIDTLSLFSVLTIGESAFWNCSKLRSVTFGENLETIGYRAFEKTPLTEVELPGNLREVNQSFYDCKGLKKVVCHTAAPPTSNNGDLLYGCDKTDVKLYVPALAIDYYRAANGWKEFYTILPIDEKANYLLFRNNAFTIADGSAIADGCRLYLNSGQASVTYNDSVNTLSMSLYNQWCNLGISGYNGMENYRRDYDHTSLIACGPMRADSICTEMYLPSRSIWYFISLPYDVQVKDIACSDGVLYALRKYSGLKRSQQQTNNWINLTPDSVMHAHEGYILKCSADKTTIWFPAMNNGNKNKTFERNDAVVALNEYVSEFEHNRSWNLVGNPYPCWYDTRFMDFTAPITVWNRYNSRYDAFSPVDDSYVLHPAEAFFVQRPVEQAAITFAADGRQTNATVRTLEAPHRAPAVARARTLYNMELTGDAGTDHTRLVINSLASTAYELDKDAAKLIEADNTSLLLYTLDDGVRYAINERDMSNGIVALGCYLPADGDYTLSLTTPQGETATLLDRLTGHSTTRPGDYTFSASAGTVDNRFELAFTRTAVTDVNSDNERFTVEDGTVTANTPCTIYAIDGRCVGTCTPGTPVALPKGIYVISGKNVNHKIVVK